MLILVSLNYYFAKLTKGNSDCETKHSLLFYLTLQLYPATLSGQNQPMTELIKSKSRQILHHHPSG